MSPNRRINYVQPSSPQHDRSSPTRNRAYNYFTPLSQENTHQTSEKKNDSTHQLQQWTTLQAPSLNLTNVTQTTRSPPITASGGNLQPTPHSTTPKTSKSQRTILRPNYPLPLYPEGTTQTSAPSSPTSPKQGAQSNTGPNKPNPKTSRRTQQNSTNGFAPAQLYSKKTKMSTTPGQYQLSSSGITMTFSPHPTNSSISSYKLTTSLSPSEQTQSTAGSQKSENGPSMPRPNSSLSKPLSPNATSFTPSFTMPIYGTPQEKMNTKSASPTNSASSSLTFKSHKTPTSKRWIRLDNHADLIAQPGECLTPISTEARVEQNPILLNPKAADHPENENCMKVYTRNVHGL